MSDKLSTTHIAGNVIYVLNRTIQRCSLCGEKLCDSKNTTMPINIDGYTPEFPTWTVGRLVRVTEGNPTMFTLLEDTNKLPVDSCIDLLED